MNLSERSNSGKNCLLVFRNKKDNNLLGVQAILDNCASHGYHFDKVWFIAYDSSFEITFALKNAIKYYENIVLYSPSVMSQTLKDFITHGLDGEFNEYGRFTCDKFDSFILLRDKENKLSVEDICAALDKKYGLHYEKAYIKTVGAPISALNKAIGKIKEECPAIDVNVKDNYGDCTIEIVYNNRTPKAAFDKARRVALSLLNSYVYTLDNSTLAERLVALLKLRKIKLSVAESFTGGGISKRLVEVPGVSEVYFEGLNTYANEAKISRLGVSEQILSKYGAVSEQVAAQMAEGLLATENCTLAISTTGIAGPKSDGTKKPVGLAYIGVATPAETEVFEFKLKGSRECITQTAINLALFAAFKMIK